MSALSFEDKPLHCRPSDSAVRPSCRLRVTPLLPGDSYWTIIVSEIPSRCLNKPSNRAIILKQKVTSGVTTAWKSIRLPITSETLSLYLVCGCSPSRKDRISSRLRSLSRSLGLSYPRSYTQSSVFPSNRLMDERLLTSERTNTAKHHTKYSSKPRLSLKFNSGRQPPNDSKGVFRAPPDRRA